MILGRILQGTHRTGKLIATFTLVAILFPMSQASVSSLQIGEKRLYIEF